ncbi:mitochondrial cardiolipin hydrolase-like [Helicoverpa zea]|uniref:mitochondrial cardiolipin hydrolase-like n=1 Tax=Helicoverpa zea TaxID=7113 RepID=UPI001F57DD62|nr:mitochondrial cardiolipin hydrolase-like [Helicoverpa zea]
MSLKSYSQTLFLLLSLAFVTRVTYNYLTKKKKAEKCKKKEIQEVIMFSYGVEEVKKSKYSRCMISKSMDRLLYYLNQPRHTLDICMYVWTNMDITNAVLKLHYRGVRIRVILDADMAFSSGSSVRRLEKQRIPVRWMKSTNLMHHKFCLADMLSEDPSVLPFVMAGSLNWTNQALCGNFEDCLVTSQKELVEQYRREFERLWILFKPIVD